MEDVSPPMLTCEPVLTEAAFLLKREGHEADPLRLSELHTDAEVFTLDSDFRIYRRHGNKIIPVLMPE